jgi:Tol biopolymer transport system component
MQSAELKTIESDLPNAGRPAVSIRHFASCITSVRPKRGRLLKCLAYLVLVIGGRFVAADEPKRLTHDGRQKQSPVFCWGGRELVYVDFADATLFQLRRLVVADGTSELLHSKSAPAEFEPTWSVDGENYAHLKLRGVLSISIVVRDRQGTLLHEIQPGGGFNGYRSPALAPDHSRLAFSYAEKGAQQIYSSQLNGEDRKQLTETTGINNWPCYSPDGRSIVFGSSRDGNFEIYRMNSDGLDARRLTDDPFQDIRPRFSPDGQRIAFTSHRDGNAEIYVMNADGSKPQRVTDNPERDDYAEWHPDGKSLVIVSERDGKHDLYLINVP